MASLEIGSTTVGRPTEIRWRLAKQGTGEPVAARLALTITHVEKDKKIFALEGISTEGDFTFVFHFADGSDHRVDIVAQPDGGRPIREEKVVPVTAGDPPAGAFLPPLILFLAVITLGLIAGRASAQPKPKQV